MDVVRLVLDAHGYEELNPVQQEALKRGLLSDKNLLVVAPTASGKTLIAEIAIVKTILEGRKAVYLSPLRSLATEKYYTFKELREDRLKLFKVGVSTGDYHTPGRELAAYDLIICTYERFDSLIRNHAPRLSDVGLVVIDEIHTVGYGKRGPVIEMIVSRLPEVRYIGLSATVGNPHELAKRLDAELVVSDRRPVELIYGAYFKGRFYFYKRGGIVQERAPSMNGYEAIVLRALSGGLSELLGEEKEEGQVLIFRETRRAAERLANTLAKLVAKLISRDDRERLERYALEIEREAETTREKNLAQLLKLGIAFHHAGLSKHAREVVEEAFRERALKVIVATPTLAAGVNLPARIVSPFIKRYDAMRGLWVDIPVMEFRQMAGRAGRPQYDQFGEVITIITRQDELLRYFRRYVLGPVEDVKSQLLDDRVLESYVLVSIAEGKDTETKLRKVFSRTLGYMQIGDKLLEELPYVVEDLENMGMIKRSTRLRPTRIGLLTMRYYLLPRTAFKALSVLSEEEPLGEYAYLHMLYILDDFEVPYSATAKRKETIVPLGEAFESVLDSLRRYKEINTAYKVANILYERINERSVDEISNAYGVYPGDLAILVDEAAWILTALSAIAEVAELREHAKLLHDLALRVEYGVKEELLELVSVKGIGRKRARILFSHGIRSLNDLREACLRGRLREIPGFGEKLEKLICSQVLKYFA